MTVDHPVGRLARADDYRRVYREGRRSATPLLIVHTRPNGLDAVRIGIVVSRRFGRATARNRLRRRLREAVRAERGRLGAGMDVVIVPRDAAVTAGVVELREAVAAAMAARQPAEDVRA